MSVSVRVEFRARPNSRLLLLLGAVSCTAALAFAGVLAFAAVVARFAPTFALTGILAFAGMLVLLVGVRSGRNLSSECCWVGAVRGRSSVQAGHRAAQQAGEGRCQHQGVVTNRHVTFISLSLNFLTF